MPEKLEYLLVRRCSTVGEIVNDIFHMSADKSLCTCPDEESDDPLCRMHFALAVANAIEEEVLQAAVTLDL